MAGPRASSEDALAAGRAALREGRWEDAEAAFESVVAGGRDEHPAGGQAPPPGAQAPPPGAPETPAAAQAPPPGRRETPAAAQAPPPEALEGLAEVSYWRGDYARAVGLRERAFAGYRARGETRRPAVIAAYHLAFEYAAVFGNQAASRGWLERGKRLARAAGDCPERGWVELACVLASTDGAERDAHLAEAKRIARAFDDADLEFDVLAHEGVALVESGHLAQGMTRLDEAAAAAQGGEVGDATAAGEIYCRMLHACELALDVRRAEQWTQAATGLARRSNAAWASAICRMHYGGILTAAGRWPEAEAELTTSVAAHEAGYRALTSGALVRLADLRVRQGRLVEAERLLAGLEGRGPAVLPLARLHLARGEAAVAASVLRRHLDRRGSGVLQAPALALLVEAEVAAGRGEAARATAATLAGLSAGDPAPHLTGLAALAAATVEPEGARARLEEALHAFGVAGLPLEEARTRLDLARLLSGSEPEVARSEARAALDVLEGLGAAPLADAAAALLRALGARGRTGPKNVGALSRREQEVLELLGQGLSNAEIAARLFITVKTASHHVSNVLAKLGLRNRAEAAALAASAAARPPARGPSGRRGPSR